MSFVVFLAFVLAGAAGLVVSSLVDAKPWSLWGLPPRTPEEAQRRYRDRLREHPWAEETWNDPGVGSS